MGLCILGLCNQGVCGDEADLHDAWHSVLQAHVDEAGSVAYKAIKADPRELDRYLATLARTDPASLSEQGQLAYWINAYNAFTVKLILDHYPIKSIRDIRKPWDQALWTAGGKIYSLNDIEHEILRKRFMEPRIHFAIVCASIGCPSLWNHAYREACLDTELDEAAKRFLGSDKHFDVTTEERFLGGQNVVLKMSSIFKWFKEDFTDDGKTTLQRFVLPYVDKPSKSLIQSEGDRVDIKFLDYDWNLNDRP